MGCCSSFEEDVISDDQAPLIAKVKDPSSRSPPSHPPSPPPFRRTIQTATEPVYTSHINTNNKTSPVSSGLAPPVPPPPKRDSMQINDLLSHYPKKASIDDTPDRNSSSSSRNPNTPHLNYYLEKTATKRDVWEEEEEIERRLEEENGKVKAKQNWKKARTKAQGVVRIQGGGGGDGERDSNSSMSSNPDRPTIRDKIRAKRKKAWKKLTDGDSSDNEE